MNFEKYKGRVAIITGASSGIGQAVAMGLAGAGLNLCLVGRNQERLEEVRASCQSLGPSSGTRAIVHPLDLSRVEGIEDLVKRTVSELGSLDVVVNNAGMGHHARADKVDLQKWDHLINVNLRSVIHLTRLALPELKKNDRSAIINIASISAKMSHPQGGGYAASKHGVLGFANSVFEDVRESRVKICSICPGFVNTPMVQGRGMDDSKMIQPKDIADTVLYVLALGDTACPTEIVIRPQQTPYQH